MNISVQKIEDSLTPELAMKAKLVVSLRGVMYAAGSAAEKAMKEYYRSLPGNAKGWGSVGFWDKEGAKKTALAEYGDDFARVVVDSVAMGHRFFGGEVRPKRGTALAIPLTAEAYAAGSPAEGAIPDLMVLKWRGARRAFLGTKQGKRITLLYVLVGSATHRPDPRAFPPDGAVNPAVSAAAQRAMSALLGQ